MKFKMVAMHGKGNGILITCPTKDYQTTLMSCITIITEGWKIIKKAKRGDCDKALLNK